ncbi:hypothetical protein ACWC4C_27225 [Streptomyces olivaceoviridis]
MDGGTAFTDALAEADPALAPLIGWGMERWTSCWTTCSGIVPLAALMGLPGSTKPATPGEPYTYADKAGALLRAGVSRSGRPGGQPCAQPAQSAHVPKISTVWATLT